MGGYNRWTGLLDWTTGLAEIVPKLVPRLDTRSQDCACALCCDPCMHVYNVEKMAEFPVELESTATG